MSTRKCNNCGADLREGAKFCAVCGSANDEVQMQNANNDYTEEASDTTGTKATSRSGNALKSTGNLLQTIKTGALKFKKYIISGVCILLVAVLLISFAPTLINAFGWGKFKLANGSAFVGEVEDGKTVIVDDGKEKTTINADYYSSTSSIDYEKIAFLADRDNDSYTLYYYDGGNAKKVAEGVYSYKFAISGNGIAYIKDRDSEKGTSSLYLYSGNNSQKITSEFGYYNGSYCISPNGKTVAYSCLNVDDDRVGYYWDGSSKTLGKDKTPIYVADGGKYVYYSKNSALYAQRKDDGDSSIKLDDSYSIVGLNIDFSQVVFNSNGKAYISRDGKEKTQISSSTIYSFIVPDGVQRASYIYGVSTFAETYFYNSGNYVAYLNNKYESNNVVKDADDMGLASNGKTLIYLKKNTVYKINDASKTDASDKAVKLGKNDEDVDSFVMLRDGSAIYYVNEDDVLFYQKGTGQPQRVTDDYSDYAIHQKSKKFFYVKDDVLYVSTGKSGTKVQGIKGEVAYVSITYNCVGVTSYDDGDELGYISLNGSKFELVKKVTD